MSEAKHDIKKTPLPHSIWENPWHFVACGFGSGALPWVPGTWGSLVGVLFFLYFCQLSLAAYVLVVLLFVIFGALVSDKTATDFGIHDQTGINFDEIAGMLVAMLGVPAEPLWIVLGFSLFRLFDIAKPFPINWIDKHVHGGFGMMLDDVIAGAFTCFLLQLGLFWFH